MGPNTRLFATSSGNSLEELDSNKYIESTEMIQTKNLEKQDINFDRDGAFPDDDHLCNISGSFNHMRKMH